MARLQVAALAIMVSACSKKGPECESIRKAIIPTGAQVEAAAEKADKVASWNEIAQVSDDAAARVGRLKLTVSELRKLAVDYQVVQRQFGEDAREIAGAWALVLGAKQRQEKAAEQLGAVVVKLVTTCAHAADPKDQEGCRQVQEGIKRILDHGSQTAEVQRITAELEKIPFASEDVRAATEAVLTGARASNLVLIEVESALARATAADARVTAGEEKEREIAGKIDRFCE